MFKGRVDFVARIADVHITFPRFAFVPPQSGVESVELESRTGDEISGVVQIAQVPTTDAGMNLARSAMEAALNRITYFHSTAIEPARVTASEFSPVDPSPGHHLTAGTGYYHLTGHAPRMTRGLSHTALKAQLEESAPAGEVSFGLFRSARLSVGPVEEFMHLYNILLMFHNDDQSKVDAFIIAKDPSAPQTQQPPQQFRGQPPSKAPRRQRMETVYTRLRNELAHQRVGVNLDNTKVEMARRLSDLRMLMKRAIELHP
jgi:hypothetical protein